VFLTDTGGIRMSSSHREVCYSATAEVLQGEDGPLPRALAWDSFGFLLFHKFPILPWPNYTNPGLQKLPRCYRSLRADLPKQF